MKQIMKEIDCSYLKISNGGRNSVTMWFECKLEGKVTGPETCQKCKIKKQLALNIQMDI